MKNMKKFASILLALVMAMALTVPAFAAEFNTGAPSANQNEIAGMTGSITIDNALVGDKDADSTIAYSVYRLFNLMSYNNDKNTFSYTVVNDWVGFVSGSGAGASYVDYNADGGYVTWKKNVAETAAAEFAKAALEYARTNNIAPVKTVTVGEVKASPAGDETGTHKVTVDDLALGYYLLDSALGSLCSLDTTNQNVIIKEKNQKPTVTKEVQEDSNGSWQESNTAQIDDIVHFKSTITVGTGNIKYVLHDKMSEGFTFDASSFKVNGQAPDETTVGTLTENPEDGDTFDFTFVDSYVTGKTSIEVTYDAKLTKTQTTYVNVETNETYVSYTGGDHNSDVTHETERDDTKTCTYTFELMKTTSDGTPLAGAEFQLYTKATADATEVGPIKFSFDEATNTYKVDENGTVDTIVTTEAKAIIKGLDGDGTQKYYLRETKAPDGYNMLTADVEVTLNGDDILVTDANNDNKYVVGTDTGVIVVNQTGAEMPETGGIGTTIFYTIGGLLVVAAGVMLVTKRRMQAQA